MPRIAAYPDGVSTAGPKINRLIDYPIEFQFTRYLYDDGGCDVNVQPCGVRRWGLEYEGLSVGDAQDLLDHFNLAKGRVNNFTFFHRRDMAAIEGVQYESLKVQNHPKYWANSISIMLIKLL